MIGANVLEVHDAERSTSSTRESLLTGDGMPPLAAHLVTLRTGYTHHGIYVGDGKVVHYAGLSRGWRRGPVEEVTIAEFSRGRPVRVRTHTEPRFDHSDVIDRARSRLGENHYLIFSNNCEHFCEWCVCGESRSLQIELLPMLPRCVLRAALRLMRRSATVHSPSVSNSNRESESAVDGLAVPG